MATSSGSGLLAPIENLVMPVASAIPVSQVKTWLSAYFHPVETFDSNKKDATLGGVVVHMALVGVLVAIATLLSSVASLNIGAVVVSAVLIVAYPILFVIFGLIGSALMFVLAKILGGKGGFMEQTLGFALLTGGYYALSFPFIVLSGIPLLGFFFGLLTLLLSLYNLYNEYLLVKRIHQFSSMRAAIFIILPVIIAIIIVVVLIGAIIAMLAGAGLSAAALRGASAY
ncbi:MAG: YIP1 family protein [Candidatus Anstonellaceae archaeon]